MIFIFPSLPLDLCVNPSTPPALTSDHMAQLVQAQLRVLSADGSLELPSMSDVAIPAFYAAHMCR